MDLFHNSVLAKGARSRFHIETLVDARTFEKFHLDIGIGDVWIEPLDTLTPRSWLEFMGIPSESYPAISKEQQLAEKIHAYTLPRQEGRPNSRVKDLIDMVLLIDSGEIDQEALRSATNATFSRRKTHSIPSNLPNPPKNWTKPFGALAKECDISENLEIAHQKVSLFFSSVF